VDDQIPKDKPEGNDLVHESKRQKDGVHLIQ
jgi:hypothetical protein